MASTLTSDKEASRSDSGSEDDTGYHSANLLFEYRWPAHDPYSETYMLQEQVVEYLEIRGFSRKYPDLYRRPLEVEEREFLVDLGVVTETQSNLGLVALSSQDVYQLMYEDYPSKFREYMFLLEQRSHATSLQQMKEEAEALKQKQIQRKQLRSSEVKDLAKLAAAFNSSVSRDRARRVHLSDIHPAAHWIRSKAFLREQHDKGHNHMQRNRDVYPACILPGQYSDTVNSYFSEELKRLPVNTVVSPLPSLCLCIEGTSTAPETVTDIRPSVEQECSSENIIEEMDLAEQLTVNSPIASQDSILVKKKISLLLPHHQLAAEKLCVICRKSKTANSFGYAEELLQCSKCYNCYHPSCLGFGSRCLAAIKLYSWECNDCKLCWICEKAEDDDKVILCDLCDRGFHLFCIGLDCVPHGSWLCDFCFAKS